MTRLDEIIANALAGIPETDAAILAREVVRLREARVVVVPAWDVNAFALACVKEGAYAEGDLRNAIKNAEMGYNFAVSRAYTIPADRVLGEGEVKVLREDVEATIKELDYLWPTKRAERVRARFFDALRANQGVA